MSDNETDETEKEYKFYADRAKSGRAGCRKCKQKIEPNTLRMAKVGPSPFGGGLMKLWHHIDCMFEVFSKQRKTTAKVEHVDDIGGWDVLSMEDKETIIEKLPESARNKSDGGDIYASTIQSPSKAKNVKINKPKIDPNHKDNSLREFRRLCAKISEVPGYLDKTRTVKEFLIKGSDGESFKGDLTLLIKLLLPGVIKRVYNLQSKQIIKLFSKIFGTDQTEMLEHLELGDVAETISLSFDKSTKVKPSTKSLLTIYDVDNFLDKLSNLTREQDQIDHFSSIVTKCTSNDLKMIIRLIKHDLRINAGAKHILDAVHDNAYEAFQASRDINSILKQVNNSPKKGKKNENINVDINVLVPVLPMLAQACKSVEEALKKCPNGMYSEIKYDGERVQVHKKGNVFKYYSRSLKPILPHKVKTLEDYFPLAFPSGSDMILDSEILMIDTKTGKPLPFGSLGIHKKNNYKDASVCLYVFDCMHFDGKSLINMPMKERRKILMDNMTEVPFKILHSEMKEIFDSTKLEAMMTDVFKQGLEGLMLKDIQGTYEPGKRHWLKVKKDYLHDGAMADSADLVVLGASYGTGKKGGMMSVFLMGCLDERRNVWCTVTKVHTGHDDKTLEKLQNELKMIKISKDATKVPSWLNCTKTMVPDFIAQDPKEQPVWQITGAEFTKNVIHTADGISIRFPRVTNIRDDKNWETATNLELLKELYQKSKDTANFTLTNHTSPIKIKQKRPHSPAKNGEVEKKLPKIEIKNSTSKTKYEIKNPLPDVFTKIKLSIPKDLPPETSEKLKRYFIAYGGNIIEGKEDGKPTHKIVDKKVDGGITLDEIWESVRKSRLVL